MIKHVLLVVLLMTVVGEVSAQSNIVVRPNKDVNELLNAFVKINTEQRMVEGWRVQILATTDRQRLESVLSNFKLNYPSIPVDWVHSTPYYKLRAGAFQTKQEAERLKYSLGEQFDGVYLVKDEVSEIEIMRMY